MASPSSPTSHSRVLACTSACRCLTPWRLAPVVHCCRNSTQRGSDSLKKK
ncbi:Uncharacterised protein [Bordetella pertussis]|nr:Uncharacterised protein [Bordetella pertussis]CFW45249.1 Uncharacterised protein [Bordetella pertussis]